MVIAAYYNGGGNAATAVLKGQQPPKAETQNYLKRIDKWLSDDMGPYSKQPAKHVNKLMMKFGTVTSL